MGAINFSLDLNLVKNLKKVLPLDIFVETGTFEGDTIENVKDLFSEIYSVELSEEYYNKVKKRFQSKDAIHLYLDSSEKFLKKIHPVLKEKSVLYWLDAHWCVADKTAGEKSQCPLLDELVSIRSLNKNSIIIIDDARLLIAPPPSPHEITQWPDFNSIIALFRKLSTVHETIILNDTIIFYPKSIRETIKDYAYENSINWLTVLDKSRDYDTLLKQQKDMLKQMQEKDKKIIVLSDDLVGKEKEIDDLLDEIKDKDDKIISLSDDLVGKEKEINSLLDDLKEKKQTIVSLSDDLIEKDKKIFALSDDLIEKDKKIFALSDDLIIKENTITKLSSELIDKESEIVFLSESLSILKKRLSTPIWGLITLFQFHFPKLWDYIYKKRTGITEKKETVKKEQELEDSAIHEPEHKNVEIDEPEKKGTKAKKNKLKFFTPRLGQLNHYEPTELLISPKYLNTKLIGDPLRLSIVTPSYNQAEFLERTIKSVLDQNYPDLEYVVQDGGSTDGSIEILEKYKAFLKSYSSERDKGQADAINKGFKLSTSDIMAYLNSDDIYLPGTFNYIINYFNTHSSVDVVYGHRILINDCDKEIGRWILPRHDKKVLAWADFIPQETLFWRRRIWEKVGGNLNDEFNFALDWDLLLRFQEAGAIIKRLPRFLAAFRVHPQQKTSTHISSLGESEMKIIREKYIGRNVSHAEINKNIFNYLAKSEVYHKLYQSGILRNK
ncbi:MAG: glycosyltransferase [Ignavibacteriales bacterium]|nr:glycosyltransferase [Ignavibacteriales bacterium]